RTVRRPAHARAGGVRDPDRLAGRRLGGRYRRPDVKYSRMSAPALAALLLCARFDASHGDWNALVARRVSDGWVDYAGWKRADQGALAGYLASLAEVDRDCFERFSERE